MAGKKNQSVVAIITQLTRNEAYEMKSRGIEARKEIAPKAFGYATTGTGENISKAISKYEARRITKS